MLLEQKLLFAYITKIAQFVLPLLPWHRTCLLLRGVVFRSWRNLVYIQFNWTKKALVALAAGLLALSLVSAQTMTDEGKRKLKSKSSPSYPEIARHMNIGGKVRIEVVIAPDGHVRSAKVIGGHPILVQSCLETVKEWKYEPAAEETTQIVEFEFRLQQ